jgi:hypothetical protein
MICIHRTTPPDPVLAIASGISSDDVAAIHSLVQQAPGVPEVQRQLERKFRGELGSCLIWALVRMFGFARPVALQLIHRISRREEQCSTGVGRGTAIPHTRTDLVSARMSGVLLFSNQAFDFESIDQEPIRTLCVDLAPFDPPGMSLRVDIDRTFLTILRDVDGAHDSASFQTAYTHRFRLQQPWQEEWVEPGGADWS